MPRWKMTMDDFDKRHRELLHAIQSGVEYDVNKRSLEAKHLRVGITSALVEHGALVKLLIAKEVFTEVEYAEALIEGLEREVREWEQRLEKHYGTKIVLE